MLYFKKGRKYSMVNIDEYLVKIEVPKDNGDFIEGSGVIFPLEGVDYDYIITALHCLKDTDLEFDYKKIIITRKDSDGNDEESIEIIDNSNCYESDDNQTEKDFVVIKIRKFKGLLSFRIDEAKFKDKINVSCYPSSKRGDILSNANGVIKNNKTTELLYIKVEDGSVNIIKNANEKMGGASGAGVFKKENELCFSLVGILTEIGNIDNSHNELVMLDIKVINDYLKKKKLISLDEQINYSLKNVHNDIFYEFKDTYNEMRMMLRKESGNLKEISTKEIVERIGKNIFFPEDKGNYNDKKLWEGWLEYLTFVYLNSKDNFFDYNNFKLKSKEFLDYAINDKGDSIKFIYSNVDSFAKIICSIYKNDENKFYKQLKDKDKVIINNLEINSYSRNPIFGNKLTKVVKDISLEESDMKLNQIDNPVINKQLKFFHLQNIKHKMQNDETEYNRDHDKIKKCIMEILEKEVFND